MFFILALSSISVIQGSNSSLSKIIAVSGKNKNSPSFELDIEELIIAIVCLIPSELHFSSKVKLG